MRFSIVIPTHNIPERGALLQRCLDSLDSQKFRDFEIVIASDPNRRMGENLNAGLAQAQGEWVKILCMDDWLTHPYSLMNLYMAIREHPEKQWVIQPTTSSTKPGWTDDILSGRNWLGPLSSLAMKRGRLFRDELCWLIDCEMYWRLMQEAGSPLILGEVDIGVGTGPHQETHKIPGAVKEREIAEMSAR
jgi:glycosyltransferase involved in cell wall biosynthesis